MPDPIASSSDAELRALVERALAVHYELDREIGRGGMGIVYRARDRRLKRVVAIKLLPPELAYRSEIRTRFLREAETAAQLSHPNIVPIYSVDEKDHLVFFVMAYIEGPNLAKRLQEVGRMAPDETRRILGEVADALAYAHGRHVIHRDIKPDNILLDAESGRAMVTDFGIARAVSEGGDSRLTATGMAIGTPAYMSPEQCAGDRDIDGRSDVYALGVVGYQMLAGELPFTAPNTPAMLVKHLTERPRPLDQVRSDVPPDLARAIMMMLEKEPMARFPSAHALVVALEDGSTPELASRPTGHGAAYGGGAFESRRSAGAMSPVPASPSGAYLPMPYPTPTGDGTSGPFAPAAAYVPTSEEMRRWGAPEVQKFRRKLAFFIPVNIVIVVAAVFNAVNLLPITGFWAVYLAYKYAGLWTNGYDWRDVLREPREREFADVAGDWVDDVRAVFSRRKRDELRARRRLQQRSPAMIPSALGSPPALPSPAIFNGPHAAVVRQAALDRDAIVQLVESMPKPERDRIADVLPSATALFERVESLAVSLAELERTAPESSDPIDREIAKLEAEANPLDREASEQRSRRLAFLKRQRRGVADVSRRREEARSKLDSCALALQGMRFDILRFRSGAQTPQGVTQLAEQAMSLAREVDHAVFAADQVSRLSSRGAGQRGADAM